VGEEREEGGERRGREGKKKEKRRKGEEPFCLSISIRVKEGFNAPAIPHSYLFSLI